MIRSRHSFQKIHEVDISSAGGFNITTGEKTVHRSIDQAKRTALRLHQDFGFVSVYEVEDDELTQLGLFIVALLTFVWLISH